MPKTFPRALNRPDVAVSNPRFLRISIGSLMTQNAPLWIIRLGDKSYGPYSSAQLKQLVVQGQIKPDTPVQKEGTDRWVPAIKIKGLIPEKKPEKKAAPTKPKNTAATRDDHSAAASSAKSKPAEHRANPVTQDPAKSEPAKQEPAKKDPGKKDEAAESPVGTETTKPIEPARQPEAKVTKSDTRQTAPSEIGESTERERAADQEVKADNDGAANDDDGLAESNLTEQSKSENAEDELLISALDVPKVPDVPGDDQELPADVSAENKSLGDKLPSEDVQVDSLIDSLLDPKAKSDAGDPQVDDLIDSLDDEILVDAIDELATPATGQKPLEPDAAHASQSHPDSPPSPDPQSPLAPQVTQGPTAPASLVDPNQAPAYPPGMQASGMRPSGSQSAGAAGEPGDGDWGDLGVGGMSLGQANQPAQTVAAERPKTKTFSVGRIGIKAQYVHVLSNLLFASVITIIGMQVLSGVMLFMVSATAVSGSAGSAEGALAGAGCSLMIGWTMFIMAILVVVLAIGHAVTVYIAWKNANRPQDTRDVMLIAGCVAIGGFIYFLSFAMAFCLGPFGGIVTWIGGLAFNSYLIFIGSLLNRWQVDSHCVVMKNVFWISTGLVVANFVIGLLSNLIMFIAMAATSGGVVFLGTGGVVFGQLFLIAAMIVLGIATARLSRKLKD